MVNEDAAQTFGLLSCHMPVRPLPVATPRFWMQGMNKSLGFIRTCQAGLAAPEPMPEPIKIEAWEV